MKTSAMARGRGQLPYWSPARHALFRASQLAARRSCGTIDDRRQHSILSEGGLFVVARKERLKSSIRVIGQLSIGFIKRRWCRNIAAAHMASAE